MKPKQKKFYEWIDQEMPILGGLPFKLYRLYLYIKIDILFEFVKTVSLPYADFGIQGSKMEVSYKHGLARIYNSTPLGTTEYIKFTYHPVMNKVIIEYHYYSEITSKINLRVLKEYCRQEYNKEMDDILLLDD